MTTFDQVKLTPRDQQVLNLLAQGCSNKEIGGELSINLQSVKTHLRTLFYRVGILDGRKRVKLARYVCKGETAVMTPCDGLTPKETQISILVWEGLTNREIGKIVGTSEQMIKNHLHRAFDKLGVWSRLELAMYVANHGGKDSLPKTQRPNSMGMRSGRHNHTGCSLGLGRNESRSSPSFDGSSASLGGGLRDSPR